MGLRTSDEESLTRSIGAIKQLMNNNVAASSEGLRASHQSITFQDEVIHLSRTNDTDISNISYARSGSASPSSRPTLTPGRSSLASRFGQLPRYFQDTPGRRVTGDDSVRSSRISSRECNSTPGRINNTHHSLHTTPNLDCTSSTTWARWSQRSSQRIIRQRKIEQESSSKFNPPPRRTASAAKINGIVNRLSVPNAEKIQARERLRQERENEELLECQDRPHITERSKQLVGELEHIAMRTKKVIQSKEKHLHKLRLRQEREKASEVRPPQINEKSRRLLRERAHLTDWAVERDRKLEEKRKHAAIDPECTFHPKINKKSTDLAKELHSRTEHPGPRMYREVVDLEAKKDRARQQAEKLQKDEESTYFRPRISAGSERLARARSRERKVWDRLWEPSPHRKSARRQSRDSARETPRQQPDTVSFDHARNRRLQETPITFQEKPMYAHHQRDQGYSRRSSTSGPRSHTPEFLSRGRRSSYGGMTPQRERSRADSQTPKVVPIDERFHEILSKVMCVDSFPYSHQTTAFNSMEKVVKAESTNNTISVYEDQQNVPKQYVQASPEKARGYIPDRSSPLAQREVSDL